MRLLRLLVRRAAGALVQVAVVPDLVAGIANGAHRRRPALRGVAGDEESGTHAAALEEAEDTGHAGARPVRLVGHHVEPAGSFRVLEQDRALGIQVEGEAGSGADAIRPAEAGRHRRMPVQAGSAHRVRRRSATSDSIS